MARRPRSDKADRVEAIFADFDLLPIKDARFVVRAIRIALVVKERNQALAEAPTSQLELAESKVVSDTPITEGSVAVVSDTIQREPVNEAVRQWKDSYE